MPASRRAATRNGARCAQIDAALEELQNRWVRVQQARASVPTDTGEFAARIAALAARVQVMRDRLAQTSQQQSQYLDAVAESELRAQKERLDAYAVQARFALADIYDRAHRHAGANGRPAPDGLPRAVRAGRDRAGCPIPSSRHDCAVRLAAGCCSPCAAAMALAAQHRRQPPRHHRRPGHQVGRGAARRRRRAVAPARRWRTIAQFLDTAECRSEAARRGAAPARRPESRVGRTRAHGQRGDADRHAGRRGHPAVHDAAQGLPGLSAQRPGALPAGARL